MPKMQNSRSMKTVEHQIVQHENSGALTYNIVLHDLLLH